MVKYELQQYEQLIQSAKPRAFSVLNRLVSSEVERIKFVLVHGVYNFEDERFLQRYIQLHQQGIIRLMDLAVAKGRYGKKEKSISSIYLQGLEELLAFIECHFTKYFDQDAKVPESYFSRVRNDIISSLPAFELALSEKKADSGLSGIILRFLRKVASNEPTQCITYRKLIYVREIQKELGRVTGPKFNSENINEGLRQVMHYLNYNSGKVLAYFASYIQSLLDQVDNRNEKIERLSLLLKNINQAQVKPDIRYNSLAPGLRSQLTNYIAEEIEYLEKIGILNEQSPDRSGDPMPKSFKLKFETSVPQLAYLLKVFMEKKILVNSNVTEILHFLVKFVITKRAETISYASFRSKFYNVEDGTKKAVRTMLVEMIQHIERE